MHSFVFKLLKVCQKIDYTVGVAYLAKLLFLIPSQHKRSRAEQTHWDQGERYLFKSGSEGRIYYSMNDKFSLKGWIVCVHGWSGRGSQFYQSTLFWTQAGYSVLLIDGPGHGRHRKRYPFFLSHLDIFSTLLKTDLESWGQSISILVGHSFGGAASVIASLRGLSPKAVLMVGSPNRLEEVAFWFSEHWSLNKNEHQAFVKCVENHVGLGLDELDTDKQVSLLKHKPAPPVVVLMHDQNDKEVPVEHAYQIQAMSPGVELVITHGLGHRRILRSTELTELVLRILSRFSF